MQNDFQFEEMIDKNYIHRLSEQLKESVEQETYDMLSKELEEIRLKKYTQENPQNILYEKISYVNELLVKKNWSRLKDFQKEERIIKFLESENVPEKIKNKLLKSLVELRFSNCVDYDVNNGTIREIYCLVKDDNGKYHFDKDKIRNKDKNKGKDKTSKND